MIRLPATFKATHQTGGLDGYPAIDVFGLPGETIQAGFTGTVRRISGRPCSQGGVPGGAYGQSLYIRSENGDDRYLTHLNRLLVAVGDKVTVGTNLATLCDSKVSGKPGTTHVHYGLNKAKVPIPLYDITGPKGRKHVAGKPIAVVSLRLPGLVKQWGPMRVEQAKPEV